MTSSRAYRSTLSPEEAYKRIIEGSGSQFDPSLVAPFKKVFPLWKEMFQTPLVKILCFEKNNKRYLFNNFAFNVKLYFFLLF